jgi:hypothetical protein
MMDSGISTDPRCREHAQHYRYNKETHVLSTAEKLPRIVPRPRMCPLIATAAHETCGHRGYRSVADALRLHYTWKGVREAVKEVVDGCVACKQNAS